MNDNRRKELREAYRNRHPDMGVLNIVCTAAGENFLFISKDTATGFNRHRFQLEAGMHPNRALQALWRAHGADSFDFRVAGLIEYDDPQEDQSDKLQALLEKV